MKNIFITLLLLGAFMSIPFIAIAQSDVKMSPTISLKQDTTASTEAETSQSAQTKQRSGIQINPAVLDVDLLASESAKIIEIELTNYNTYPIMLELFAINFRQGDLDGLVQFLGENSTSYTYSLASFIHLPFNEIELDAGEKSTFEVVVQNRQDLAPGGHYAGIIARQKTEKNIARRTNILPSVSSLILLKKIGGEQYNLSIREVDWPDNLIEFFYPKKVSLTFQNEGNVHLVPYGRIEIRDIFGRLVSKAIINPSSLYIFPSSRRRIPIEIKSVAWSMPISFNTMTVRGNDSLKKTNFLYQEAYLYINPVTSVAVILLPIIFFILKHKKIKIKRWSRR